MVKNLKIDCIADLHGHFPTLPGGDLLILAGDYTSRDEHEQHEEFCEWLDAQTYSYKVVVAGNHDNNLDVCYIDSLRNCHYLEDRFAQIEHLKIWGTPWSLYFPKVNPRCTAFMGTEEELEKKYSLIPEDIDILISHSPPFGIVDKLLTGEHCGSLSLRNVMINKKPKYLVCGHIHECGGKEIDLFMTKVINCSYVNEKYEPVNQSIRLII